jgi:adenylosuccinate lyase
MPFKRNPILSEKINSLARELAGMPRLAWDNAALSMLERRLDDSANRRSMLPESFLISDELLQTAREIFVDLRVDEAAMQRNLAIHGAFAGLERVLIALVKKGANRQEMLHRLRDHAMEAWQRVQREGINPIEAILCKDEILLSRVTVDEIHSLMDSRHHIGNAPLRAKRMAETIRKTIHR